MEVTYMRKIISLFLLGGIFFIYSCKPSYTEYERSQLSDNEVMNFISNMEETIDLLEQLLEKIYLQIEENNLKIKELELRINKLEKLNYP